MGLRILLFTFFIFLINNKFTNALNEDSVIRPCENCLLNNYDRLLKIIRCEYCSQNDKLPWFNHIQRENCANIRNECIGTLNNRENLELLRNIISNFGTEEYTDNFRINADNLKKIINIIELQTKDIDVLRKIIDSIREHKAVLLINNDNNASLMNLSNNLRSLRNNVDHLQRNQDLIQNELSLDDQKEFQDLQELYQLKNELDDIYNGIDNITNNIQNYELGGFSIEGLVNDNLSDLIGNGGMKLVDTVSNTILQDGTTSADNSLVNIISDGKELAEQLIEKSGKQIAKPSLSLDEDVFNKLDHLKTKLTSHEILIDKIKSVFLNKLKEYLLKTLHNAYASYRRRKARENGESDPTINESLDINDMKKGIIEIGMKLLFSKLKNFLKFIKSKIFPQKNPKLEGQRNMRNFRSNTNQDNLSNNNDNNLEDVLNHDQNEAHNSLSEQDIHLLKHIDRIIDEINYYTRKSQNYNIAYAKTEQENVESEKTTETEAETANVNDVVETNIEDDETTEPKVEEKTNIENDETTKPEVEDGETREAEVEVEENVKSEEIIEPKPETNVNKVAE
ncbi:merozoite surface protein 9, putative [Plasmodium relictum]|uniref:Merozoite surface protein 9, putative n=1 Tax=Plasmodium relictum TaxID=85471 RepID=A0A1J1HB94_PLARL|nr:merozoite surface protein 9, putative [Plasmodium relictum]CRH02708.1 merozoite surface protein 9, putative [Plasmodium relictum]